jgi:hypothetical protein
MQTPAGYTSLANALRDRILALMPDNPTLATMDDPWGLFKVPGFKCDDLGPTLAQAAFALRAAQQAYRSQNRK